MDEADLLGKFVFNNSTIIIKQLRVKLNFAFRLSLIKPQAYYHAGFFHLVQSDIKYLLLRKIQIRLNQEILIE